MLSCVPFIVVCLIYFSFSIFSLTAGPSTVSSKRSTRDDFTVDAYGNRQPATTGRPRPVSQPAGFFQQQQQQQQLQQIGMDSAGSRPVSRMSSGGAVGGGGGALPQSKSFCDERAAGYKTWSQADANYFFQVHLIFADHQISLSIKN